ncbi:hypothetical protein NP493_3783g00000 [Ridgeia piscesae]|uniref:Uncharacterized protein n=1 Tax=Ridgeia piscesae TaxID=27915 RepID=A0AAD9MPF5_RIDPI|nr:hypothetical protein NP493_8906g00005 [Ridgeia piscesae]KAK2146050.1 hypothetical protein NP493_3783g00000 [Ridgeia piscesae]
MYMRRQRKWRCVAAVCAVVFLYGITLLRTRTILTKQTRMHRPICSFDIIKEHCVKHNYFPTGGHWVKDKNGQEVFMPDICGFTESAINPKEAQNCLKRREVKRMLFLGDSNGIKYFETVVDLLNQTLSCKLEKEHHSPNFMPDVTYFTNGTRLNATDIVVHYRDCRQCYETLVVCSTPRGHGDRFTVKLEFLAMEYFLDTEVTTVRTKKQNNIGRAGWHHSTSTQEFIFSEYLKMQAYPDVILLFSSNHDKARNVLEKMRADMEYLKSIINLYVPSTTELIWFSILSEHNDKKPKAYRNRKYERKYAANEYIQLTNRHLFEVLLPEWSKRDSVIKPFFDIYSMSYGVLHWSTDGIHRERHWYRAVISRWLQTFCV